MYRSSGDGLGSEPAFDISRKGVVLRASRTAERKVTESRTQGVYHAARGRGEGVIVRRDDPSVIVPLGTILLVLGVVDGGRPTVLVVRNVLCWWRRTDA
jgi:hypothetical protein